MPVFGEETFELPIFNGLGVTDRPVSDLCSQLVNMFMSAPNELRIREDFVLLQSMAKTPLAIPITAPVPRTLWENTMEIFTAVGSETVDSPSILAFFDDGTTRDCKWLNTNAATPVSYTQTIPATYGVKAFCQYRDRYYASNGSTKIYRLSGFSAAIPPLTCTDLMAAGVDILITFRSRVFGIKKNRIYYTDLPTIGGYPEVWDINLKFVDIPSVDYDVTVHNAYIYKDKIYLFTDKGVYVFNVVGDPTNWSIQLVSSNFPIYDRDSVALNKNYIFLTDQTNVVIFDGSTFKVISENIRSVFHNSLATYTWFSIYAWEDGILLSRNPLNNVAGNYSLTGTTEDQNLLYFNMAIWIEVKFGVVNTGTIKAGRSLVPFRGKIASSWICMTTANNAEWIYFLEGGHWKGDVANVDHVGGTRTKKPVVLQTPAPFLKDRSFKKYKFVDLYGWLNDITTGANLKFNNETVVSADRGKSIWKIPIQDTLGSQFKGIPASPLLISGLIDAAVTANPHEPPFLIVGADLVYNQDNRGRDGMG